FGIAKTKSDKKLTRTGTTMGSLFYMSAEQVQGNELDGRSDLYSVGVSLYELVTGSRPFQGKSDYAIMVAQLQEVPTAPIQLMPDLPKALNDIIMISLEKDPAKRFQTAEAFSAALGSVTPGLNATPMQAVSAAPVGSVTQWPQPAPQQTMAMGAVAPPAPPTYTQPMAGLGSASGGHVPTPPPPPRMPPPPTVPAASTMPPPAPAHVAPAPAP